MWRKSREEKRDYMNLTWLNHQYYDLGRSLQDIADDQGVSMMTINKWVDKIEKQSYVKTEEKSFKTCPSCKLKLNLNVKFCFNCGKKVEEDQVTPIRSEERSVQAIPIIKEERQVTKDSLSETEEKQPVTPVLDIKVDILKKLKFIPPICKFCEMELNEKATFCLQCGSRIKKK